jgi:hypothetical protein
MKYNFLNMPKATEGKQPVHLLFEAELTKRIDDFRYKQRFPTRAAAIKWLLEWALQQKPVREKV